MCIRDSFLSEHEIVNGFFFGPALVVDGEVQEIPENYQFDPHQKNPRAGIAQLGVCLLYTSRCV